MLLYPKTIKKQKTKNEIKEKDRTHSEKVLHNKMMCRLTCC